MALLNKELKVKVELHSSSGAYYGIYYKRPGWFKSWYTLVEVWDGASLSYDQPVLFSEFEAAVEFAKKLKENPELIDKHYERQDEIYKKALQRRNAEWERKNKAIII